MIFQLEDARIFSILLSNMLDVSNYAAMKIDSNGIVIRGTAYQYSILYSVELPAKFFDEYYGIEKPFIFVFDARSIYNDIKKFRDPISFDLDGTEIKIRVGGYEFRYGYSTEPRYIEQTFWKDEIDKAFSYATATIKTDILWKIATTMKRYLKAPFLILLNEVKVRVSVSEGITISFVVEGFPEERLLKEAPPVFKITPDKMIRFDTKYLENLAITEGARIIKGAMEERHYTDSLVKAFGKKDLSSITTLYFPGRIIKVEYPLLGPDETEVGYFKYFIL